MLTAPAPNTMAGSTRAAWLWLAAAPLFVVIGLLSGYAVEGLSRPEVAGAQRSLLVDFVVGVVVLVIWLTPAFLAHRSARAAADDPRAKAPLRFATVLAVGMLCVVLVAIFWNGVVDGAYS